MENRKKLFITHDFVEIYEGDYWWYIRTDNGKIRQTNTLVYKGNPYNVAKVVRFSTKKAAEEYRDKILNKVQSKSKDNLLPRMAYLMCVHGALICGSFAKKLMGEDIETNDYDLLVPLDKWQTIALMIPQSAKTNKFGGWRFKDEYGNEYDVWPSTVQDYLQNCKTKYGGKVYVIDFIKNKAYSSQLTNF